MSIPFLQTCNNKRKRRTKVFDFHTFTQPINPTGPFRYNVHLFLQECVVPQDYPVVQGMPVWCTLLLHHNSPTAIPPILSKKTSASCPPPSATTAALPTSEFITDYGLGGLNFASDCHLLGWSSHYLSKRRHRLIIPTDHYWSRPLDSTALNLPNHILHGMIHANGYGHLLTINGIEGGSEFLSGREIMDLWDHICTNLLVGKITVEDVSRKRGMDEDNGESNSPPPTSSA